MKGAKDLANPYLGGFGFSRPKAKNPRQYSNKTIAPAQITLDSYHHPRKRLHPELHYLQAYDLYSYVQYPLLHLDVLTHQRYLQSTNNIALNSESLMSRQLLTENYTNSLGTVLLEIGLWQSLETLTSGVDSDDPKDVTKSSKRLIKLAKDELPGQMGNIYAEVVKECLISIQDDSDLYTQDRLCWKVNAALDQCMA